MLWNLSLYKVPLIMGIIIVEDIKLFSKVFILVQFVDYERK